MGTRTIGLDDEAYERLAAQKRDDESFSDVVKRLTDAVATDWREGFGRLDPEATARIDEIVADSRKATSEGLAGRQRRALDAMDDDEEDA